VRKLVVLAAVVFLISCVVMSAEAQTWSTGAVTTDHYVGVSKGWNDGNVHGLVGMNALCSATFGSTAHMCNVDEFFSTAHYKKAVAYAPLMWVQPSLHNCLYDSSANGVTCAQDDLLSDNGTGPGMVRELESKLIEHGTCQGRAGRWTNASSTSTGLAVAGYASGSGAYTFWCPCDAPMPVACCAP
jgi:hypothetical protein